MVNERISEWLEKFINLHVSLVQEENKDRYGEDSIAIEFGTIGYIMHLFGVKLADTEDRIVVKETDDGGAYYSFKFVIENETIFNLAFGDLIKE